MSDTLPGLPNEEGPPSPFGQLQVVNYALTQQLADRTADLDRV